jgi:hypothetical protein
MSPQFQERGDDGRGRGVRAVPGPPGPIGQPRGPRGVIAVDPFVGRLPADAESPRQVRDVELVALVIRDELHALIHE